MAIAVLPTTDSTTEIVFTEDPDVTPRNGARGWILASEAEKIAKGADRLTVRPLNLDERAQVADVQFRDGLNQAALARNRKGVVKAPGGDVERWLSGLAYSPAFLLSVFIDAITNGEDTQTRQGLYMSALEGGPEGSKS